MAERRNPQHHAVNSRNCSMCPWSFGEGELQNVFSREDFGQHMQTEQLRGTRVSASASITALEGVQSRKHSRAHTAFLTSPSLLLLALWIPPPKPAAVQAKPEQKVSQDLKAHSTRSGNPLLSASLYVHSLAINLPLPTDRMSIKCGIYVPTHLQLQQSVLMTPKVLFLIPAWELTIAKYSATLRLRKRHSNPWLQLQHSNRTPSSVVLHPWSDSNGGFKRFSSISGTRTSGKNQHSLHIVRELYRPLKRQQTYSIISKGT
ncbi:hypothetical protein DFH27DRAFT_617737 [Peziza echinospora]|nr:hypothetical protein DFH27DRAFT_617737 [Peziza echinospora]